VVAEQPSVTLERDGNVARLTLNRPDSLNALNRDLIRDLTVTCRELDAADDVRVVLVRGAGERAFCVGADLKERSGMDVAETQQLRVGLVRAFRLLRSLPMPTVAAVHG